jgi:hypothetical protein
VPASVLQNVFGLEERDLVFVDNNVRESFGTVQLSELTVFSGYKYSQILPRFPDVFFARTQAHLLFLPIAGPKARPHYRAVTHLCKRWSQRISRGNTKKGEEV